MPLALPSAQQVKPFFRAALGPDKVLEFLIYEDIGESWDWITGEATGVTAKSVKTQIDAAGAYSSIRVRINSPGGDAFEGIAILNLLKTQGKPVNVMVDGIAASAASIIAMAGDTIEMGSGAMMMIHNAWGFCMGNAAEMVQMSTALGSIDKAIAKAYADRTGQKVEEISAAMSAETWMTADECLEKGFATGLQGAKADPQTSAALSMARNFKVLSKFSHVPDALKPSERPDPKLAVASAAAIPPKEKSNMPETPNQQAAGATATPETAVAAAVNIDELRAQAHGEALEVIELCQLAGKPEMALNMIRAKTTPAKAREQLLALAAKKSEDETIHSHITPEDGTGVKPTESPVVAQAKKRAAEQQKGRAA